MRNTYQEVYVYVVIIRKTKDYIKNMLEVFVSHLICLQNNIFSIITMLITNPYLILLKNAVARGNSFLKNKGI